MSKDRVRITFYFRSIVTIGLSCIVSEINGDAAQISDPPLLSDFCKAVMDQKTRVLGLAADGEDRPMCSSLGTIAARDMLQDGQPDRQ